MERLLAHRPRSLKTLVTWLAATNLAVAAVIVALTFLSLQSSKEADQTRARETTENLADSLSIELGAEMKLVDNALATIALQYGRVASGTSAAAVEMERAIADQRSLLAQVDTIRITDAQGNAIYGLPDDKQPIFVGDRDYFLRARTEEDAVVSEPLFGRGIRSWGIVIARALRTADGDFAGIVYTNLSTDHFMEVFKGLTIGPEGAISLRTASMRLVARYSAAEPHTSRGVGEVTVSQDLLQNIAANPRQGWYLTRTRLDNIERITCYRQVRGYPLTIFTGTSTADFLANWHEERIRQCALAALAILTVLGCSVLIYRQQRREVMARADVSRVALEQNLTRENERIGMMRSRGRIIVWSNRAMGALFGYAPEELQQQTTRNFYWDEQSYLEVGRQVKAAMDQGQRFHTQLKLRRKDGTPIWIDLSGARVGQGEAIWMLIDITAVKDSEASAQHLAVHDAVTSLPNRVRFTERLAGALSLLDTQNGLLAVCYVDMEGFKAVNAQVGHEGGDVILRVMAQRLQAGLRVHDLAARMGGDRFAVLLTALHGEKDAHFTVGRLLKALTLPIRVSDHGEVTVEVNIGIAFAPGDSRDAEGLLQAAEASMLQAKRAGVHRIAQAAPSAGATMTASVDPSIPSASPTPAPAPEQDRPHDPGPPPVPDNTFDESVAGEEDPGATLDGEDSSRIPPAPGKKP